MRTKTTRRDWLLAAQAFADATEKDEITRKRESTDLGLCYWFSRECGKDVYSLLRPLEEEVTSIFKVGPYRASSDWTPECDNLRVLLACLLATLTDKEREEVFRS